MARYDWFTPIEPIFYEALQYHDLPEWFIEPMPNKVDTRLVALRQEAKKGWLFRTHNGRGQ